MNRSIQYKDLSDFCERNPGLKLKWIAEQIGVDDPARFSKLKDHKKYGAKPTDDELSLIAKLLNQPKSYVRDLYEPIETEAVS